MSALSGCRALLWLGERDLHLLGPVHKSFGVFHGLEAAGVGGEY